MTVATVNLSRRFACTARYGLECIQLLARYPKRTQWTALMRYYPPWFESLNEGRCPLTDGRPWLTFAAIDFLETLIRSDSRLFEWGAGGSTMFFNTRAARVVTVEHDKAWLDAVRAHCAAFEAQQRWKSIFQKPEPLSSARPDPADCDSYTSASPYYCGSSFYNYVSAIDEFPDYSFDIILIDGRARPSCFKHAIPKIKPGGYIVWDNTERSYYSQAMRSAPSCLEMIDFPGPSPYAGYFTRTTMWRRLR